MENDASQGNSKTDLGRTEGYNVGATYQLNIYFHISISPEMNYVDDDILPKKPKNTKLDSLSQCLLCMASSRPDWDYRTVDRAHLCQSCAYYWEKWGRDKFTYDDRSRKRPRLDFVKEPLGLHHFQTLLASSYSCDLEKVGCFSQDKDYLSKKKKQIDFETKLQNDFGLHTRESSKPKVGRPRGSSSMWTAQEAHVYIEVLRQHGRDLRRVYEALDGSKTLAQVRQYWKNYHKKKNLDQHVDYFHSSQNEI
eukprot:m.105100 g.105100  ORF g.105100 m.105100 type:complete len:251 (+) comp13866_c0_seq4:569-1321(+)